MVEPLPASFVDLLRLWRVDPVGHSDVVIDASRELADAGDGGEAVAALAADGPAASRAGLERLVTAVEAAAGVEPLSGTAAQDAAVGVMARRQLDQMVSARELTYWVTRVVGLRGGPRTQVFLDLEQDYCTRLGDDDVADLDARVAAEAERFLGGADEPEAVERSGQGLRGWLSRRRTQQG